MKTDLQLINNLLSRYYAGSTTPAENDMLLAMLDAVDESELTPELRTERDILHAIYDSGLKLQSDIDIPDGLEQRILDATVGVASPKEPDSQQSKHSSGILYRIISVAAAVILVLGISWRFFTSRHDVKSNVASSVLVAEAESSDSGSVSDNRAAAIAAEHMIAESTPAVKAVVRPVSLHKTDSEAENNTIMITEQADSLEAMRVTMLALQTIDKAMNKVGNELAPAIKCIEESNRQIENTAQIIKNSLI